DTVASSHGLAWIGDRSTAFFNPFRNVWVHSTRISAPVVGRARSYWEHPDPAQSLKDWQQMPWLAADRLDPRNPDFPDILPQLYNFDAFPYESLMIGLFSTWCGPENGVCDKLHIPK